MQETVRSIADVDMKPNVTDLRHLAAKRMKVAVLSDTHGLVDPRIGEIVSESTLAVHAGDIGSAAVLNELSPKIGRVMAVRGNNDITANWHADDAHLLEFIPSVQHILLTSGTITVEHGHTVRDINCYEADLTDRYHEELRGRYPDSRVVVYGHTHRRVIDQAHRPWVINPGAAGRVRTRDGPSCLLIEISNDDWHIREFRFEPI
ncbi:MAG: metallophosphoesterase family protein [Acidiferrobacterales bacterium]|nr:metallophosphoesterase family protein [Acidiferrobacterales bacterium]